MPVILHIEDEDSDQELFAHALRSAHPGAVLRAVPDAMQAMSYLERQGQFGDASRFPRPDLIVLDYKLPGMDGLEFLAWLRGTQDNDIPLVVLTGCIHNQVLDELRRYGALMVVVKPGTFARFKMVVDQLARLELNPATP